MFIRKFEMSEDKDLSKLHEELFNPLILKAMEHIIKQQQKIIDEKDREIGRLKEALKVYGNVHNWKDGFFIADNFYSEKEEGWELAKLALIEIEGE